jgi:hypothetical protein
MFGGSPGGARLAPYGCRAVNGAFVQVGREQAGERASNAAHCLKLSLARQSEGTAWAAYCVVPQTTLGALGNGRSEAARVRNAYGEAVVASSGVPLER